MKTRLQCVVLVAITASCSDDRDPPSQGASQSTSATSSSSTSSGGSSSSTGSGASGGGGAGGAASDGWAFDFGDTAAQGADRVVVDSADHIVVSGTFSGTIELGATSMTSTSDGADAFITKLDPDGAVLWAVQLGTTAGYNRVELAIGPDDDVFVAGHFGGSFTLQGETFDAGAGNDVYAARWSSDGELLWIERFACDQDAFVSALAVDGAGGVVFGGLFDGTCDFGEVDPTAALGDGYLVALDPTGGPAWWRQIGGAFNGDSVDGLSIDDAGNVAVSGAFRDATDFGDGVPVMPGGDYDLFLARYDGAGAHLSHLPIAWEGTGYLDGSLMDGRGSGEAVMTGQFQNVTLDGQAHAGEARGNQIFLAGFDSAGQPTASAVFGELGTEDHVRGIALAPGSIALTGYAGEADFGGGPLASGFVAVLSSTGDHLFSDQVSSGMNTFPEDVALDSQGYVIVVGAFADSTSFGFGTLDGDRAGDAFVLKRRVR
jgi:hypothetical protein